MRKKSDQHKETSNIIPIDHHRHTGNDAQARNIDDMNQLDKIYSLVQTIHNKKARRVATLAVRSAQVFVVSLSDD